MAVANDKMRGNEIDSFRKTWSIFFMMPLSKIGLVPSKKGKKSSKDHKRFIWQIHFSVNRKKN